MEHNERVLELARQAAGLLPGPPDPGHLDGYLSWRELIWSTAARLSRLAGRDFGGAVGEDTGPTDEPVTAEQLLVLAGLEDLLLGRASQGLTAGFHRL